MASRHQRTHQQGAALLIALLTVTLIATFAATALWQQWRATEIEAAERARMQSAWVLVGGLDWSRLILRADANATAATGGADHLAEPWALPLAEARLSSFLAADKNVSSDALEGLPEAFLSGQIVDAQGKLNVRNLVGGTQPDAAALAAFQKLFSLLGLPPEQVSGLATGLRRAARGQVNVNTSPTTDGTTTTGTQTAGNSGNTTSNTGTSSTGTGTGTGTTTATTETPDEGAALMPQRVEELVWLGLPASTVAAIAPYVTLLPQATKLNLNTATAETLYASVPELDLASAQRVVAMRQGSFFREVSDANKALPQDGAQFKAAQHGVSTNYFEVTGRLRLDKLWVEEHSLLYRQGINLSVIWRQRGAGTMPANPSS